MYIILLAMYAVGFATYVNLMRSLRGVRIWWRGATCIAKSQHFGARGKNYEIILVTLYTHVSVSWSLTPVKISFKESNQWRLSVEFSHLILIVNHSSELHNEEETFHGVWQIGKGRLGLYILLSNSFFLLFKNGTLQFEIKSFWWKWRQISVFIATYNNVYFFGNHESEKKPELL